MPLLEETPAGTAQWTLDRLIERHRSSARPAILAPGRPPLSFAGLDRHCAETSAALRAMGLTSRHRVASVVANGPEAATGFLAFASSTAFAPLNPRYTRREFEFFLEDLRADALLVDDAPPSAALEAASATGLPLLRLSAAQDMPAGLFRLSAERPALPAREGRSDAALLLHTSGTTSRPKLVPLSASNLAASALHIGRTLALTESDLCLNIMPLFHIHGLMAALLASLAAGAAVVCTDGVYGAHFFDWLDQFRPTWYTAVPTMHQAIHARGLARKTSPGSTSLRFLRSSSASLAPQVLEQMESLFQAPMLEAYGMTEAAHQMASNPLPPGARKPGSVGPAAGPEIAIMNELGRLLDPGLTGEVVIRGPNVMAGYEAAEEVNRAAFTEGWFRTGDQGFLDEDGYLRLTGRLKELINRGGEKISPREIDEVVLAHPSVKQALSFAVPHAQLGEEIGVAVELEPGASLTESELRRFAGERLPPFKLPRLVRVLDEIPKGPTGKLQRIGLAASLGIAPMDDAAARANYVEPRTEVERRLAQLWREVLHCDSPGILDTFESLGGDSLLTVRAMAAASRVFGLDLPFLRFLEERTLASMVADIEAAIESAAGTGALVPVHLRGSERALFCAPGHDGVLLGIRRLSVFLHPLPVWALPLPGGPAAVRIEQLGRTMADGIVRLQPDGPVRLAGVCFGGLVAFEAARDLQSRGRQVELLALIDTLNPAWRAPASALPRMVLQRAVQHWRTLRNLDWDARRDYLAGRMVALELSARRDRENYTRAQARYAPAHPLHCRTLLFEMPARRLPALMLGWEGLLGGHTLHETLPFDTAGSLSDRCAPQVARAILRELDRSAV